MKKIERIGGQIGVAIFIIGFIVMLYEGYQFRHHYSFSVGTVTAITPPGYHASGDYSIVFAYEINGKAHNGNNNYNFCSGQSRAQLKTLLIGKQFPVVYSTNSPSLGFMLLTQRYADKFNYALPDSVRYYDSVLTCK